MATNNEFIYKVAEIRNLEELASQKYHITADTLMARAGAAVMHSLRRKWPTAGTISVVCGRGNNGGDGYVVAALAQQANLKVQVLQLAATSSLAGAARNAAAECHKLNIKMVPFSAEKLVGSDLIVDAIVGIGVVGELRAELKEAIRAINASKIPVIAVDLPSGIDADSGKVLGAAIRASLTVTFIGYKAGLYLGEAPNYSGEIVCDTLGLDANLCKQVNPGLQLLALAQERQQLTPRSATAHKGDCGALLVVGGDWGMGGAVAIAAQAAARVGSGLVRVATRVEHVTLVNALYPEIMVHGIAHKWQLLPLLASADAIVVGPGLGTSRWGKMLLAATLATNKPLVVDADALTLLSSRRGEQRNNWILTPHPGEAARLLGSRVEEIQAERITAGAKLAHQFGGVVVLKGARTLITTQGERVKVCGAGNPGMASGGMGDLLSGIIGGLVVQGVGLFEAASLGVALHATAGDHLAAVYGERGILALDLLPIVRRFLNFDYEADYHKNFGGNATARRCPGHSL